MEYPLLVVSPYKKTHKIIKVRKMIDKFIYKFLGWLDSFFDKFISDIPEKKRKKK
jgi:hypothetical protein